MRLGQQRTTAAGPGGSRVLPMPHLSTVTIEQAGAVVAQLR